MGSQQFNKLSHLTASSRARAALFVAIEDSGH